MDSNRVWLITGASSGFGEAVTCEALKRGETVLAIVRSEQSKESITQRITKDGLDLSQLKVHVCDVRKTSEIRNVINESTEKFGGVDVVLNSAGYGILGEIEGTPVEAARELFDVNFWAVSDISREAIRVFRERGRGGRLINISSGLGMVGGPGSGYYSASKHALEGFTESLTRELDPSWNIKITILEPGAFKTRTHNDNLVLFQAHEAYEGEGCVSPKVREWFKSGSGPKGDVNRAAEKIFELSRLDDPPLRLQLGKDAITGIRSKMQGVLDESNAYKSWSENVGFDN